MTDLIDILGPIHDRHVAEVAVKPDIPALFPQAGRRVDLGVGVAALPITEEDMMKRVGRDEKTHLAQGVHFGAKPVRKPCRGPQEQTATGQSDDGHPRRIMKPTGRHHGWTVGNPYFRPEFLEDCNHFARASIDRLSSAAPPT